ncbi:hypothetical protein FOZ76_09655 [Verticiella sediminum]|uniref:Flagellar brake protein n=1 Tax=Verticiella sediminum TaxID=1247510 RepID=A0A556ATG7_9BURK|nr:flagellar brake protein [Verticiella sediminum]TSH95655.1 hypothetical protein FOZ76_09655 [Verticiella sediminum]
MPFDPEYLLSNPVDIGSALRELTRSTDRLMMTAAPEPIAVTVCSVQVRTRTFRFHPYAPKELGRLLALPAFSFEGSAFGAQIAFEAGPATLVHPDEDEGLNVPVLECAFPAQFYRMQRRQHVRVMARPGSHAVWRCANGGEVKLRIFDVSLGGVGLRSRLGPEELPRVGTRLEGLQLDFQDGGSVVADLLVVGVYEATEHDFTHGQIRYLHMGCAFAQEDRQRERFLERLVRQLETRNVD